MNTGCFYTLAVVNNAALNMEGRYLFELMIWFPLDTFPEAKLLDYVVVLIF